MKSNFLAGLLIFITLALLAAIGCTGPGNVREQQENIAAACSGITLAMNAISLNAEQAPAGAAKVKAKALAADALVIAKPTKDFCEPEPAVYLSPTDYAALLTAAADLALKKKESVP